MNKQSWRHLFITQPGGCSKVRAALGQGNYWALGAPVYIISAWNPSLGCSLNDSRVYAPFELGLSVQNILLQAASLGLIGHPMAGFEPGLLRESFQIPSDFTIMTVTAIAWPGPFDGLNEKHQTLETSGRVLVDSSVTIAQENWTHGTSLG